jgi:hypothetical protein
MLNYAAPPDAGGQTQGSAIAETAANMAQAWPSVEEQRQMLQPLPGWQGTAVDAAKQWAEGVMMGTTAPGDVPPPGIVAYHGSPADFNRFDDRFIGTGEGAQMYGRGHYFGGVEETGLNYRNNLSGSPNIAVDGTPITKAMEDATKGKAEGDPTFDAWVMARNRADHAWNNYADAVAPKATQDLIGAEADNAALAAERWRRLAADEPQGKYENYLYSGTPNPADRAQWTDLAQHQEQMSAELRKLASSEWNLKQPGHMYEVNIGADPEHFLDWDKPLSEQSQHVQEALKPLGYQSLKDAFSIRAVENGHVIDYVDNSGQARTTSRVFPTQDAAEQAARVSFDTFGRNPTGAEIVLHNPGIETQLHEAGIPGIRYLDAGSRNAGDGSRNTVVFDPAMIEILRKYGIAGLIAGGGAAAAGTQQQPSQ